MMRWTLLIVDDHASFRSFARQVLEAEGFVVVGEAADGEGAIRQARQLNPEVVLLDIMLPDLDGFAVCARLSQSANPPAVVLTSSRDASGYRRRMSKSAARGFIPKSELSGAALAAIVS
jgi:DNA-binding NarL/FixJ family response regulator